jgi:hypothetical protein
MRWSQRRIRITRNNVISLPRITRHSPTTTQPTHSRSLPYRFSAFAVITRVLPRGLLTCRLRHIRVPVTGLLMLRATRTITGYTPTVQARLAEVRHTLSLHRRLKDLRNFEIPKGFFEPNTERLTEWWRRRESNPAPICPTSGLQIVETRTPPKQKREGPRMSETPPFFLC